MKSARIRNKEQITPRVIPIAQFSSGNATIYNDQQNNSSTFQDSSTLASENSFNSSSAKIIKATNIAIGQQFGGNSFISFNQSGNKKTAFEDQISQIIDNAKPISLPSSPILAQNHSAKLSGHPAAIFISAKNLGIKQLQDGQQAIVDMKGPNVVVKKRPR